MARGYTTRKLEVWSVHARLGDEPVPDYADMLTALSTLDPTERKWESEDKVVALPLLTVRNQVATLIAYEGPRGQPIIFDTEDGTERSQPLAPGEIVATKTHAVIDIARREAIIEYNHRGARAADIAVVLGVSGRQIRGWSGLFVDLVPKVDRSFVEGLEAFDRVRVAGFAVSRPNTDWTQWDDVFARSAADSGAHSAQVEYRAPRGRSLHQGSGVVRFIRERTVDGIASLKSAFVTGTRHGESAETRITTGDHKEHQRVAVRLDPEGKVQDADIERRLAEYHEERAAFGQEADDQEQVVE
jgi:hypothetical protein